MDLPWSGPSPPPVRCAPLAHGARQYGSCAKGLCSRPLSHSPSVQSATEMASGSAASQPKAISATSCWASGGLRSPSAHSATPNGGPVRVLAPQAHLLFVASSVGSSRSWTCEGAFGSADSAAPNRQLGVAPSGLGLRRAQLFQSWAVKQRSCPVYWLRQWAFGTQFWAWRSQDPKIGGGSASSLHSSAEPPTF